MGYVEKMQNFAIHLILPRIKITCISNRQTYVIRMKCAFL